MVAFIFWKLSRLDRPLCVAVRILVIHGPNLNLLGVRESSIYGHLTLEEVNTRIAEFALQEGVEVDTFQSNSEGEIVARIQESPAVYQALIINPAAYTHTSIAIRDAVAAIPIPAVEVHLTNIYSREDYRHRSFLGEVCAGQICGFGAMSYILGLMSALALLRREYDVSREKREVEEEA